MRYPASVIPLLASLFCAMPVYAHQLDLSYLDVSASSSSPSGLALTVAMHDGQVFELVRAGKDAPFNLDRLREHAELISAYTQDHVAVYRDGARCSWDAGSASIPATEFDVEVDGITVAGPLDCPGEGTRIDLESTLFLEGFPTQKAIVRLELPGGFAERLVLDRDSRRGQLDTAEIQRFGGLAAEASRQESPVIPGSAYTAGAAIVLLGALFVVRTRTRRKHDPEPVEPPPSERP